MKRCPCGIRGAGAGGAARAACIAISIRATPNAASIRVCCTIENQRNVDKKLSVFQTLPIKHKCITAQPLIERVNLEPYLDGVELVVVGGESDRDARPLDYDWVLDIREQCIRKQVDFEFRQCGTYFIKDDRQYKLQTRDLCRQARLAGINYKCTNESL